MRYVFAITALALAAVFAIMGLGQITFLSGPSSLSTALTPSADVHYSVIPGDVLMAEEGQAALAIRGKDVAFAGYGSTADVEAWVAPFEHNVFSYDAVTGEVAVRTIAGVLPDSNGLVSDESPKDATDFKTPIGSDLWLGEVSGDGLLTLYTDATADTSIIFASDGAAVQPTDVKLLWLQNQNAPWFGPLMVLAGVFTLVGLILYLLAADHDKRAVGPRRGRTGPFQGLRVIAHESREKLKERANRKRGQSDESVDAVAETDVDSKTDESASEISGTEPESETHDDKGATGVSKRIALGFASLLLVTTFATTGCSAKYWPQTPATDQPGVTSSTGSSPAAEATNQTELRPIPVSEPQLHSIVSRITTVADDADKAMAVDAIRTRFVGSALAQREANYKIRAAVAETPAPLSLTANLLGYNLIQSTAGWPRTILATTKSMWPEGQEVSKDAAGDAVESPALALVLRQESPYSNYMVHSVIEVRGGIVFPEAAAAEEGVALMPSDTKTLLLPPDQVGVSFGQILTQGEAAPSFKLFDLKDDPLLAQMGAAWVAKAQAEAAAKGESVEYSIETSQADDVVALSTGATGALVSVTVNEKHIAKSTQARGSVKLTPSVKALSGLEGSKKSIYQLWQHQMMFFVPTQGVDEKIRVLGSTTAMTGAGEG